MGLIQDRVWRDALGKTLVDRRAALAVSGAGLVGGWLVSAALGGSPLLGTVIAACALAAAVALPVGLRRASDDRSLRDAFASGWTLSRSDLTAVTPRGVARGRAALFAGFVTAMVVAVVVGLPRPATFGLAALLTVGVLLAGARVPDATDARLVATGAAVAMIAATVVSGRPLRLAIVAAVVVGLVILSRSSSSTDRNEPPGPSADSTVVLLLVVIAAALMLTSTPRAHAQDKETVKVGGKQTAFKDTGINVPQGKQVTLTMKGKVQFLRGDDKASVEADGAPAYYSGCDPIAYCGQLLARLGTEGPGGPVPASPHSWVAHTTATLQLAVNDFDPTDNKGEFTVTVEIDDAPSTPAGSSGGAGAGTDVATPSPSSTEESSSSPRGTASHALVALLAAVAALAGLAGGRALAGMGASAVAAPTGASEEGEDVDA